MADLKRHGRPPLDATTKTPSADLHLKLSAADYDRAHQIAKQRRESIQDVVRRGLKRLLNEERSGSI